MGFSVAVLNNKINALQKSILAKSVDNVRDAADFCAAQAIALAPIRTGSLYSSIYVSGPGNESNYPERLVAAAGLNSNAVLLREIRPQDLDAKAGREHTVAIIAPSVEHGIFIEHGTRYMGPKPFLTPAAEATRNRFVGLMADVADF